MKLAEELKSLMPSQEAETLKKKVIEGMKEAAKKDYDSCRLSSIFKANESMWNDSVYYVYNNNIDKWKKDTTLGKVFAELEKEGIKVKFLYEERQFVDMDILISWK